jgi:hypothetical protein
LLPCNATETIIDDLDRHHEAAGIVSVTVTANEDKVYVDIEDVEPHGRGPEICAGCPQSDADAERSAVRQSVGYLLAGNANNQTFVVEHLEPLS